MQQADQRTKSPMGAVDKQKVDCGSRVAEWYAGRSVLVTGATGFMGKAIVEKLVRSCPGIATIYLLVRPKRGQDPQGRLKAYASDVVFSKVRDERPDFARHLSVVAGDVSALDFRLAEQDMAALQRDVSVVFHCAASIRFDDSLRKAVTTNVVGTQHVLHLAEQLPRLKVFLHMSTSFCHSDHPVLEEKLYPAKGDPEKIMDIVSWMDDDLLQLITPKLLGNLPNTYALSKNLSEELVARYSDRLPIVIARPSIVTSAFKEPMEGWVSNLNGPVGFLVAAGKGVLRAIQADLDIASDFMPIDFAANAVIIVAWHVAETRPASPYVVNVAKGRLHRVTWREAIRWLFTVSTSEVPLRPVLWYPQQVITTSALWYAICHFFLELLPAHVLDFLIRLSGRKPFLVNVHHRLESAKVMLRYYIVHEWTFINNKILSLYESLAPEDKKTFYFNIADVDPYKYLRNGTIGIKLYLLNERLDNKASDLKYIRRMYWLHITVQAVFYGLLLWLLYSWSQPALETLETVLDYLISKFHGGPAVRTLVEELPVPCAVGPQDVAEVTKQLTPQLPALLE